MTKIQAANKSIKFWEEAVREYDKPHPKWLQYLDGCGYCEKYHGVCADCPIQDCDATPFIDYLRAKTSLQHLVAAMSMLMFYYYAKEEL